MQSWKEAGERGETGRRDAEQKQGKTKRIPVNMYD